ncbi:MAG: hypothetical protein AB8F95_10940 [Bacteroidia bacterium]
MRISLLVIVSLISLLASCGSADLAVLNEVNMFSPKWQEVSQQFAFVKRNVERAVPIYKDYLAEVEPRIDESDLSKKAELLTLRNRYREVLREGEKIHESYKSSYGDLKTTVTSFNEFQTRLMRNKLSAAEARADFATYKVQYRDVKQKAFEMQSALVKNIESHNSISSAIADLLGDYQTFKIETH